MIVGVGRLLGKHCSKMRKVTVDTYRLETVVTTKLIRPPELTYPFIGPEGLKRTLQLFCLDLSGTIHIEDELTPNAKVALETLKEKKYQVKYVTNTTKESRSRLLSRLNKLDLNIVKEDIFSSLSVTNEYIRSKNLKPIFLVDDAAMEEFDEIKVDSPDSVVIGLAPDKFRYDKMNEAFRVLMDNQGKGQLVAIHKGRYFMEKDGLSLGPGPFVETLESATGRQAHVVGKPNINFFNAIMQSCSVRPRTSIMIGDDVNDDIIGALRAGMNACLVRTGKYQAGDENTLYHPPGESQMVPVSERALVVDSLADAVRLLT